MVIVQGLTLIIAPGTRNLTRAMCFALAWTALLVGCEPAEVTNGDDAVSAVQTETHTPGTIPNGQRSAYFGDLHVHTANSYDAYGLGAVRAGPDDAYRYATGEAIRHPLGYSVQLRGGPLDFYAVTDHAEYLGVPRALADPDSPLAALPLAKQIRSSDRMQNMVATGAFDSVMLTGEPIPGLDPTQIVKSTWQANILAAERYNRPGDFTTFIAYEYTSTPGGANLHRNVIFSDSNVPEEPFGSLDSPNPEDLWNWLDAQRAQGIEALAIPHNSNLSGGIMFARSDSAGEPIDAAYAAQRSRNEPLMEITQVKGTSETHPALSPTDEWAGFEIWKLSKIAFNEDGTTTAREGGTVGAYARDALLTGLEIERSTRVNPYAFGFIGSTDTHVAASPVEENQYFGKAGLVDGSPEARGSVPLPPQQPAPIADTLEWGASGLAGVWAEKNTRAAIYAALRRKETFGTSGPRIQVRFFAGYEYPDSLGDTQDAIASAYAGGVPMGGELTARSDAAPKFFVWALRDPNEAWLQRAQIIKGWLDDDGEAHEQVFDVACSDGLSPDARTHRCPDNGATVNLDDCSFALDKGAVELRTVWRDPTFDSGQRAFYYLRVLQNPTCRWSTWDAVRAGVSPNPRVLATLQERAWSSPIWYVPDTDGE